MSTYERQNPETIIALQAARIETLEKHLREAVDLARITEREVRAILAGCGDTDEQIRASVPLTNLRGHLENGFLGGPSREAGSGASPQEEKHAEAGTAPAPPFAFGTRNAAAGAEDGTAESVSEPPLATPTKPAGTSALSDEQMAAIERGITEPHLCVVYPLARKRAFASGRLPPRGPRGAA